MREEGRKREPSGCRSALHELSIPRASDLNPHPSSPIPHPRFSYLTNRPSPVVPVKKTIQKLLAEYGTVAVVVYFVIFFAVLGAFWLAISLGWQPTSAAGSVGTFAAAYIATKLTQPLRIAATLVITPFIAKLYERIRGMRDEG